MGTHPIFESDFDCLTEIGFNAKMSRKRPVQNDFNSLFGMPINIKKQKQKVSEISCSTEKTNGTSNGTSKKKKDKSTKENNHDKVNSSDKVDKKLKKEKKGKKEIKKEEVADIKLDSVQIKKEI